MFPVKCVSVKYVYNIFVAYSPFEQIIIIINIPRNSAQMFVHNMFMFILNYINKFPMTVINSLDQLKGVKGSLWLTSIL